MKQNGFTLLEVLISIAIFVFIALAVGNFGANIFSMNASTQANLSAQLDGRKVLKHLVAELRSASPSSLGSYPLEQAGTSTLIFYTNLDEDTAKERVRYYLSGSTLYRGVIHPSGNPLSYAGAEKTDSLIHNVSNDSNTPLFEYFDSNQAGTSSPLVQPVTLADVRLIRATIIIDENPARPPSPITITTQVMMRNLKDNF